MQCMSDYQSIPELPLQFSQPLAANTVIHWFRFDALRLHDNPAFVDAVQTKGIFKAIFIVDPWFNSNYSNRGPNVNVWRFLLEALHDIDSRLQKKPYCTRLNVLFGQPTFILSELYQKWNVKKITFQSSQISCESMNHDNIIKMISQQHNVEAVSYFSHTLFDPQLVIRLNNGKVPLTYKEFRGLIPMLGKPLSPIPEPHHMSVCIQGSPTDTRAETEGKIPTLQELGFGEDVALYTNEWVGGETEALSRLSSFCARRAALGNDPLNWLTSKNTLSMYIKFGCLSTRQFFSQLLQFASTSSKGQELFELLTKNLLLREFAFLVGSSYPKFDVMEKNPLCIQLPWDENPEFLERFRNGRTGYPWIDAVVRQCRQEGWAHFLARQTIAVFLTRGYLWVSWVKGKEFFQEFMIDFELPVSTVCWMQSSCSGFFCNQIESYDPCLIGKQVDPEGVYIKTYVPELQNFPSDYVHQPWAAPLYIQLQAGCVVGEDYPQPLMDICKQGELCCKRVQTIMEALSTVYGTG